jgi:RNA-directed DNA polymerase
MKETSGSPPIYTKQRQIAKLAQRAPEMAFTTIAHHIDVEWLKEAYARTRKDGTPGVDGQRSWEYEQNLKGNLERLLEEAKSGSYRAPLVRRVYIDKEGGSQRALGIPTFEDKVLQKAVAMVLEPIYETDFLEVSYGYRPGRGPHDALQSIWKQMMKTEGGYVVEMDIRSYFDTIDHSHLREMVQRRVRDGVILRLIGKWLNAGVMEENRTSYPEAGSPQGGVISPLLANIYLHHVLDTWFEKEVKPLLKGKAFLVRYADDAVMGFEYEEDAKRVMDVLPKRFGKYGLKLHPDKTRLLAFHPPREGKPKAGTFDFLGFTHYYGESRKKQWIIRRKTRKGRLSRALKRIGEFCKRVRHEGMKEQQKQLNRKLKGHYGYYGITGNAEALERYYQQVVRIWRYWLSRRSQRAKITWERFKEIWKNYPLAKPRVVHSIYRVAKL